MSNDLVSLFINLPSAVDEGTFNAVSAHPSRGDFLGKAHDGKPVFLIADDGAPTYGPEIRHRHLRVSFGMACRLNVDNVEMIGQFAVVRFEGTSEDLHEVFIRCVQAALLTLPDSADTQEIEGKVRRLLALFQTLLVPSSRVVSGLWAELFCIRYSSNPVHALERWHSDYAETYDFSWPGTRVEVKSTTSPYRIHEFSLEQLTAPSGGLGKIISVMLKSSNDGAGLMDLARAIEIALKGNLVLREKLWSQLLQLLGCDFSDALDRKFDIDFSLRNLAVIQMQDIPSVINPADPRITAIRFRVDLSDLVVNISDFGVSALQRAME